MGRPWKRGFFAITLAANPLPLAVKAANIEKIVTTIADELHAAGPLPKHRLHLCAVHDTALILTAYEGALTRQELSSLRIDDMVATARAVKFLATRSPDPGAFGRLVTIERGPFRRDAVAAIASWIELAAIDVEVESGPLFRPIDKEGHIANSPLALRTITQIFRTRAAAAGIGAEETGLVGLGSVRLGKILAVAKEQGIDEALEAGRLHPESAPRIANLLRHHR